MSDYQIILLPRENYWAWVEAAKDYVLRFGCNLTPDPDSAGRYMTPQQTVTIAGVRDGYFEGDIQEWFRKNYPSIRLDYVAAQTPDEFRQALQTRLAANDRYLQPNAPFRLLWPSEYPKVTQPFGVNPEVYKRWGLPGHEGIDFRAARGSKIFACADGTVARVDNYAGDPNAQPYGNSIRIQHRDGYLTVYAHLQQILVKVSDQVRAGQVVGYADSTGNSAGDHLHLSLKKDGATAAGLTNFPRDIMDPTPFLIWPAEATTTNEGGDPVPPAVQYPWPPGLCLVGVHGRADGQNYDPDFEAIRASRMEAVKLLTWARAEEVDRLRQINPNMFIFARLMTKLSLPEHGSAFFVSEVLDGMERMYSRGVRYFEIHNECNLTIEGWGTVWQDGRGFNRFWLEVRDRLKQKYPDALFGYPGLSPDGFPMPMRTNDLRFLEESDEAAQQADFVCVHCYWRDEAEMLSPLGGKYFLEYRRRFPTKLLFITEFGSPVPIDRRLKAQQYVRYYQLLRNQPGIGAAFAYVLSASGQFGEEIWRFEDGSLTEIPATVGQRGF